MYFSDEPDQSIPVDDRLAVRFSPVMMRRCSVAEGGAYPPSEHFPLENPRPYIPHWLSIDFRRGQWIGDFGYAD